MACGNRILIFHLNVSFKLSICHFELAILLVTIKEGTLYPIIHTLEAKGLVESYWDDQSSKRKRKYYRIMEQGRLSLKEKEEEWVTFRSAVDEMLWEAAIWA